MKCSTEVLTLCGHEKSQGNGLTLVSWQNLPTDLLITFTYQSASLFSLFSNLWDIIEVIFSQEISLLCIFLSSAPKARTISTVKTQSYQPKTDGVKETLLQEKAYSHACNKGHSPKALNTKELKFLLDSNGANFSLLIGQLYYWIVLIFYYTLYYFITCDVSHVLKI